MARSGRPHVRSWRKLTLRAASPAHPLGQPDRHLRGQRALRASTRSAVSPASPRQPAGIAHRVELRGGEVPGDVGVLRQEFAKRVRQESSPRARRTRSAGSSMRSTTGCARPGRSSMRRSAWSSSASPDPSCRKGLRRSAKNVRRAFRPMAWSEPLRTARADHVRTWQMGHAAPKEVVGFWTPSRHEPDRNPAPQRTRDLNLAIPLCCH
jgi:hypothetical protein